LKNMDSAKPIRLLLVDRHLLVRTALAGLLRSRAELQVVGDAGSRLTALTQAAEHAPELILLSPAAETDLWLDAIEPLVTAAGPHARVLLLTALTDPEFQRLALRRGARGIVSLDHPPETLYRAIQKVHEGEVWVERRLVAELITSATSGPSAERARIDSLTPREREVVKLVSEGLKNKQIAQRMSVADVTVRHHLTSIFSKLEVADRLSLVVFAYHHALVQPLPKSHKRA
jgi:two-component system, NarL family, nitrate/nitrite response regulator NarL